MQQFWSVMVRASGLDLQQTSLNISSFRFDLIGPTFDQTPLQIAIFISNQSVFRMGPFVHPSKGPVVSVIAQKLCVSKQIVSKGDNTQSKLA